MVSKTVMPLGLTTQAAFAGLCSICAQLVGLLLPLLQIAFAAGSL